MLERCNYIRLSGSSRVSLTPALREQLLSTVREWGSGRDTLRCLAMATRDAPPNIASLNLEKSSGFAAYEVTTTNTTTTAAEGSGERHFAKRQADS